MYSARWCRMSECWHRGAQRQVSPIAEDRWRVTAKRSLRHMLDKEIVLASIFLLFSNWFLCSLFEVQHNVARVATAINCGFVIFAVLNSAIRITARRQRQPHELNNNEKRNENRVIEIERDRSQCNYCYDDCACANRNQNAMCVCAGLIRAHKRRKPIPE